MLDQLMNSMSGELISSLTEKAGVSQDQAKSMLPLAKESIEQGLMKEVTGGNISGILGMFNSGGSMSGNPIFGGIKQMFLSKIMSKLGIPSGMANMVAGAGLEGIMGKLGNALGGGGEVTQDSLMSKLGLGGEGALGDMAKGMVQDKLGGIAKDKLGGIGGLFGK